MTEERRYSEAELRQRINERWERVEAAIITGLATHNRQALEWMASRAGVLADGRIAMTREDFAAIIADLGRVTAQGTIEAVLNAAFHESDD